MIGRNNLILPGFYSFLQKYLKPYQINIAKILAYLAESTHKYGIFFYKSKFKFNFILNILIIILNKFAFINKLIWFYF